MILIYSLIWMHFVADFVFQSDKMAKTKSKSNFWLLAHVCAYCSVFPIPLLLIGYSEIDILEYVALNGLLHFCVDWITSRCTSKLWERKEAHWFFVVVGFDQAIHITTLFFTARWLGLLV